MTAPASPPMLAYGRQLIDDEDIAAVVEVLKSDWLTTGPKVEEFEQAFAAFCGVPHAVAVSNGTAALHTAAAGLGIGPGDEVIVPAMTFAATSNCVVYQGGTPVFADVDPDTLLIAPADVERKITSRTKAIIAVDYAGQPCDYARLRKIAVRHRLRLVDDACHATGGALDGRPVGSLADASTFSFHPVKNMTTGEGGMITTADAELAARMRRFRSHGISVDFRQRQLSGSWFYEMLDLGFNYRLTDFQCALGLAQLRRLPAWIARRQALARRYDAEFAGLRGLRPLRTRPGVAHGYHLYVVRLDTALLGRSRAEIFAALRARGLGVNVHYIPVHLHPFYRTRFGTGPGLCPVAEQAYEEIVTLPLHAGLSDADADRVIGTVREVVG